MVVSPLSSFDVESNSGIGFENLFPPLSSGTFSIKNFVGLLLSTPTFQNWSRFKTHPTPLLSISTL